MSRKLLEGASGVAEKAEDVVETASAVSEVAKKIGWKTVISAVFTLLITVVPLFFAIDSRYAKNEEVMAQLQQLDHQEDVITSEMDKIAGAQQAMLAFMAARASSHEDTDADKLATLSTQLATTQNNLEKLKSDRRAAK